MKKVTPLFLVLLLSTQFLPLAIEAQQTNSAGFGKINTANVTIVRDSFGIPHIFGKTDAEVAYGLAWANAEDAFAITQDLLATGKGFMGRIT